MNFFVLHKTSQFMFFRPDVLKWNSTYLMLEAAEKFEKVFVRLGEGEARYMSYFLEVDLKGNKKT